MAKWLHHAEANLQELAVSLLRVKVEYPSVWEGFQPYLSNLPGKEDVHTLFSFRKELIPLLQDAEMVRCRAPCAAMLLLLLQLTS